MVPGEAKRGRPILELGAVLSNLTRVLEAEVRSLAGAAHAPRTRAATLTLLSPSRLV